MTSLPVQRHLGIQWDDPVCLNKCFMAWPKKQATGLNKLEIKTFARSLHSANCFSRQMFSSRLLALTSCSADCSLGDRLTSCSPGDGHELFDDSHSSGIAVPQATRNDTGDITTQLKSGKASITVWFSMSLCYFETSSCRFWLSFGPPVVG